MHAILTRTLTTNPTTAPLLLRVVLALVILPHGLQKLAGWFGGYGLEGTLGWFEQALGIPPALGLAAVLAETLGAVLLLIGLASRPSAALIGITMVVAMVTVHLQHGFFMNWFGNQQGEGIEYFLLAVAMSAALVTAGGGRFALDRVLVRRLQSGARVRSTVGSRPSSPAPAARGAQV